MPTLLRFEARVLAWLSGQADLVHDFADGADVYKKMAAFIYQKNTNDITAEGAFRRQDNNPRCWLRYGVEKSFRFSCFRLA
jgi:hypothetical protein